MMPWREIGPYLRELWHRPAGPMNWKNPIRVFAVAGWLVVQGFVLLGWAGFRVFHSFMLVGWVVLRVGQFVAGLPPLLLFFFAALGWAGWSFVHRPFPPLDEHPILVLVEYHTPNFFDAMVVWYYVTPFAVVMLTGFISVTIWRVWLEGRRSDFASSTPSSRRGRLILNKRPRPSSSGRSITRSKRGRFSIPHGSPSRSADCIPAWRSSEPWDQAKPRLA